MIEVAARRLHAQRLAGRRAGSPAELVGWLGAVQAQDFGAAKWAVGQRVESSTESEIDALFDAGALLRTHVLRPTWHFVRPEDAGWLLELTAPRLRRSLAGRRRQLGIDDTLITRAGDVFSEVLAGGRHLTRDELGAALDRRGVAPDGQRLPHLLMAAELDRVIISGPRRGRHMTYARFDERAPVRSPREREEAVTELARRYFRSRGPAQLTDFAWWSGLTVGEARRAVARLGEELGREVIDGQDYWFGHDPGGDAPDAEAHLLPNFDEYLVAYRDRRAALHPDGLFDPALFSFGSILSNVVTIGGRVHGSWRRSREGGQVRVEVRLLDALQPEQRTAVEAAASCLAAFLERQLRLDWL